MRRPFILLGLMAALILPSAVLAVRPEQATINAIETSVTFGDPVVVEWTAGKYDPGLLWARLDCLDEAGTGLSQFNRLGDPEPDAFTTGVTPSWDGTTPRDCIVQMWLAGNDFQPIKKVTDTLVVVPG